MSELGMMYDRATPDGEEAYQWRFRNPVDYVISARHRLSGSEHSAELKAVIKAIRAEAAKKAKTLADTDLLIADEHAVRLVEDLAEGRVYSIQKARAIAARILEIRDGLEAAKTEAEV